MLGSILHRARFPDVPEIVRMTALQKANGGVRGIVAGDMVRRLVTRTIAQQIRGLVGRATSPPPSSCHKYVEGEPGN